MSTSTGLRAILWEHVHLSWPEGYTVRACLPQLAWGLYCESMSTLAGLRAILGEHVYLSWPEGYTVRACLPQLAWGLCCESMSTSAGLRAVLWERVIFGYIFQVIFYSTSIFKHANLPTADAQFATLGLGGIQLIMTFVSMILVERLGRRTLHLHGLGGVFIMMALLTACLKLEVRNIRNGNWMNFLIRCLYLHFTMKKWALISPLWISHNPHKWFQQSAENQGPKCRNFFLLRHLAFIFIECPESEDC